MWGKPLKLGRKADFSAVIAAGFIGLGGGAVSKSHAALFDGFRDSKSASFYPAILAADSSSPTPSSDKAMQKAVEIVKERQLHCLVTNAAFRYGPVEQVEFSCREGLGYLASRIGADYGSADCVTSLTNPTRCTLPENAHPALGLTQYLDEAGVGCTPSKARFIVGINDIRLVRFEVKCASGDGYILDVPFYKIDGYAQQLLHEPVLNSAAYNCLQAPRLCKWTSHRESMVELSKKFNIGLNKTCDPEDARYVGHTPANDADIYELKCHENSDSLLVTMSLRGEAITAVPCINTRLSGAECQLSSFARR